MNKKGDKLVKIDAELYDKIIEIVNKNRIEYPSIKNFVEKIVLNFIQFKENAIKNNNENNENKSRHYIN